MATDSTPHSRTASPSNGQGNSRKSSIVLIGMRGVGKTTLAQIAGKAMCWEVIDTDAVFEYREKTSISSYIEKHGWDAFRQGESDILENVLSVYPTEKVIACGGGVVELERNRDLLISFKARGIVVHVLREKDAVLSYLLQSTHFPPYIHETAVEAWDRRESLFRTCSSFEFVSMTVTIPPVPDGAADVITPEQTLALKPVEEEFFRLLRFIHGVDTNKVAVGPRSPRSYFLALTFDDVRRAIPIMEDISLGIDAWELRVDLLGSSDLTFLSFQVATLRRYSSLPIIFTVRTAPQGGRYPDPINEPATSSLHALLCHALRLGVEYIDLEITYPRPLFNEIVFRKGNASIIGSYHDWKRSISWVGPETRQVYDTMVRLGVDIAKIVNMAWAFEDNMALRQFADSLGRSPVPLLAINMGPEGKISRVLNHVLSPVSHPLLPNPSSPGQISFVESQSTLYLTGLLSAKTFYLFGNPIAHSMSPTLQNTGFTTLGLPHKYELYETQNVVDVVAVMKRSTFGGASVTIPFKRDIMPLLQHISRDARVIGAINTILPIHGGLSGENTDWRAIKTCIVRSLTLANAVTSSSTALVLGAGGTSRAALYALYRIGVVNIFIYNRTRQKALSLAEEFNKLDPVFRVEVLESLASPLPTRTPPTIIISTIPAVSTTSSDPTQIDVGLSAELFSAAGGVAVELAYKPRITRLLALAEQKKHLGWVGVEGIEVLLEQGYEQFKLWTGRRAPRRAVREKVLEIYESAS